MLLSHWDQHRQASGAFGTLEASLDALTNPPIHYSLLTHTNTVSVTGLTPSLPHTWLLTLTGSRLKMALSVSGIVRSVALLFPHLFLSLLGQVQVKSQVKSQIQITPQVFTFSDDLSSKALCVCRRSDAEVIV